MAVSDDEKETARLERLIASLLDYVGHTPECRSRFDEICDCGLEEVESEARGE